MVQITALMDNKPSENKALINEHGLSYLIQTETSRYLFDCGAGEAVLYNAHKLGKDLQDLDAVILSHSHYDHAAGYRDLIEAGLGSSLLYTGPHFFEPKFAREGLRMTDLSAGFDESFLQEYDIQHRVCSGLLEIEKGLWLVGDFPRQHENETIPDRFVKMISPDASFVPDNFEDEICLVMETARGLIVLVGCSHPGICNMIDKVYRIFQKPIYAVFGGTHLVEADKARIHSTLDDLKSIGLQVVGFSHCSGDLAESEVHEDSSVFSCHLSVGDNIFF